MKYKNSTDNKRLKEATKDQYDLEGFNYNFYKNYKFRDDHSPKSFIDPSKRFTIETKSVFETFDQMRHSYGKFYRTQPNVIKVNLDKTSNSKALTSKNLNSLK